MSSTVPIIDTIFGSLSLIAAVPGILCNIYILHKFYADRTLLSRKIFLLIALTDIATSLSSAIPFGLSRIMNRDPVLFSSPIFCNVSGLLFNITSRLSVFLISVLSFTRCIAIISPMTRVSSTLVLGSIAGYAAIQLLIASIPFVNYLLVSGPSSFLYIFEPHYSNCVWVVELLIPVQTTLFEVAQYILLFLPFFFPSVIVLASCCVCVMSLTRSGKSKMCRVSSIKMGRVGMERRRPSTCTIASTAGELNDRRSSRSIYSVGSSAGNTPPLQKLMQSKRRSLRYEDMNLQSGTSYQKRATRTITIITLLFVILNFPYWVILLLFFIEQNSHLQILNYRNDYIQCLFVFCCNVSPYLNAGINPFIYLLRGTYPWRLLSQSFSRMRDMDSWKRSSSFFKVLGNVLSVGEPRQEQPY